MVARVCALSRCDFRGPISKLVPKRVGQRWLSAVVAIASGLPPKFTVDGMALLGPKGRLAIMASACGSVFLRAPCLSEEKKSPKFFNWPLGDDFLLSSFFRKKGTLPWLGVEARRHLTKNRGGPSNHIRLGPLCDLDLHLPPFV
jgi:hypothetical protein